jgi:hypothetical protein
MGGVLMVLVVLLIATLFLHLDFMTARRRWLLPIASIVACLTFILIGVLSYKFDRAHNKTDSIFYILNGDSQQAAWASGDERPDEWTSQFLTDHAEKVSLGEYIPMNNRRITRSNAPAVPLAAPNIALLSDQTTDGMRTVRVHITSSRHAPTMTVFINANTLAAVVNGKQAITSDPTAHSQFDHQWMLNYWAVPGDGVDLTLSLKAGEPVKINVVDRTYNLPEIPGKVIKARPDYIMPEPFGYTDSTLVTKSVTF